MAKRYYAVQACSATKGWFDVGFFSKSEKEANDKAKEYAENGVPPFNHRFSMRTIRKPHGFIPPSE